MRYFYGYCGWRLGFCLGEGECEKDGESCTRCGYYRRRHPVSGDKPLMVGAPEPMDGYTLLKAINGLLEAECLL